jgi:release factor glutamine methyltransferase
MTTVEELLRAGVERLRASGSESARLDAELLLARALGIDRTTIIAHPEAPVGPGAAAAYEAAVVRREAGEPVAYIRGFKEFHGLAFATDARALIPRPETERLVEIAEADVVRRLTGAPRAPGTPPLRIADVGTGSGTIAVALAVALRRRGMLDEVRIVATDLDPDALQLARENAVGHGVADRIEFVPADLLPAVGEPFDLVAANLPYVASAAVDVLPVAASFEPRPALDGGPDGLDVIRALLDRLPRALRPDGSAVLEIGSDQAELLAAAVAERLPGWSCEVIPDLAGLPRVARLERPSAPSPASSS